MNVRCTAAPSHCNHILYEYYTSCCQIIRQRCLTNHVWPIRYGAWVAPKSRVVVRSECCDPPSATTTPARPDPSPARDLVVHPAYAVVPALVHRGFIISPGHQSVPASLRDSPLLLIHLRL